MQQSLGLFPLTLPYKTVTVTQESTTILNNLTDAVGFAIKGSDPFGRGQVYEGNKRPCSSLEQAKAGERKIFFVDASHFVMGVF